MSRFRFWQVVYALVPVLNKVKAFLAHWAGVIGVKTLCLIAFGALALVFLIRGAFAEDGQVAIALQPDGSGIIHLSPEHMRKCYNEGGCSFITRERYESEMLEAAKVGAASVKGKYCI